MAQMENENEDVAPDEASAPAPAGKRSQPLLLAGLGLVLMLGGYAAMNYVPLSPQQAEQEQRLEELRRLAVQGRYDPNAGGLDERLKQVSPPGAQPPYELPGRLAVYFGLFLFVAAGVQMYRSTPPAPSEPET